MKNSNKYQSKFEKLQAPIDTDKLWKNISEANDFPKKEDPKKWRIYLFLCSFLVLIFLITNKVERTKITSYSIPDTIQNSNDLIITNSKNTQETILQESTIKQATEVDKDTKRTLNSIENSAANNEKNYNSLPLKKQYEKTIDKNVINVKTGDDNVLIKELENNPLQENLFNVSQKYPEYGESSISKNTRSDNSVMLQFQEINLLPTLLKGLLYNDKVSLINEIKPLKQTPIKKWALSLSSGLGLNFHKLKSNQAERSDTFLLLSDNTKNIESQNLRLGISRSLANNFKITLDGELQNVYRKFDHSFDIDTIVRHSNIEEGFYARITGDTYHKQYHKYQFINLNLILEKQLCYKKFDLLFGLGASFNTKFTSSGSIYRGNNQRIELSQIFDHKKRSSLTGLLDFKLNYPIINNWALLLNVRYLHTTQLTTTNSTISHNTSSLSGNIGISIKI